MIGGRSFIMARLLKFNIPGQLHFVTAKTFGHRQIFKNSVCCEILLRDINFYRNKLGFRLLGYVIMPDHLHMIIWWGVERFPKLTISEIVRGIKSHAARQVVDYLYNPGRRGPLTSPKHRLGQGTQATRTGRIYPHRRMSEQRNHIWQPSFYDFNIYSEEKLCEKLNYIHGNPVRARLVKQVTDYKYSSAKNYYLGDHSLIIIDCINI
jgi:putative transposase